MSALPKSVQKQIDEANRIAKEVYAEKPDEQPADGEEKPEEATSAPESNDQPKGGDPVSASGPETSEPTEETPAQSSADPKARQSEQPGEGWEQRYKVLQGKYNAEVPRLQKENREMQDQLREMRQRLNDTQGMIAALQKRGEDPQTQPKSESKELDQISDEEIREFGPDLKDFIERVARVAVMPKLQEALGERDKKFQQLEQRTTSLAQHDQQTARERFFSQLNDEIPGWENQNEDPQFLDWLEQRDPYAGRTRMELLTEAYQKLDTPRVIAFFKGFQSENAAVTPPASDAAPAQEGSEEPKQESRQKLDEYVAPGTPKTGTAGAPDGSGKRVWTRKDISDFYRQRNEFVRRGRKMPEELLKLERDLHKAQQEGRIQA